MTLTRTDWAKNNTVPPKSNEAVAQIMAERGVNRRRAYELLRAEKAAKVDTSNIGQGQRIAVLACLIANPKSGRDAAVLLDALHDAGLRIDMHDTVKTLWALQKTRYVQFRERGSRSLYAIKVTGEGVAAYERMTTPPDHRDPAHLIEAPVQEVAVLSNVLALAEDVIEQEEEIMEAPPPPPININMYEWPALYALRERALRATKVNAAIRLLEEAGEDEVALTLMGKVEFNQLEQEVVNLLKIMGENIE